VNLKQFDPTWQSRRGATAYVVEVSPDPTFGNRSAVAQVGMLTTLSSGTDNAVVRLAAAVDLTKDPVLLRNAAFAQFVNSGAGQPTLYWRVGGRNNDDVPGPVHWFSKVRTDGDRTFRFIYSQPFSFKPAPLPPPPP
jgi:hypothetical protein